MNNLKIVIFFQKFHCLFLKLFFADFFFSDFEKRIDTVKAFLINYYYF